MREKESTHPPTHIHPTHPIPPTPPQHPPDLLLRCGRGAMKMDSAHRMPLSGQSCRALAIRASDALVLPARTCHRGGLCQGGRVGVGGWNGVEWNGVEWNGVGGVGWGGEGRALLRCAALGRVG